MRGKNWPVYGCLMICVAIVLVGCAKKADETKPIEEVRAEVEKMDTAKLRDIAMDYKNAIVAKKDEIKKVADELAKIPMAEKMGAEAKEMMGEVKQLQGSLKALIDRYKLYYNKLKESGGDTSGLSI